MKIKDLIKLLIPPIFFKVLKKKNSNKYQPETKQDYGWFGDYDSWENAIRNCTGYNSEKIFEKVKNSLLKVKNGQAVFERDSVLFEKIEYSFPLVSGLMLVAAHNNGNINILDFGGSLGSTYFQNKSLLNNLNEVKWNIIEQDTFIKIGKIEFENECLKFYNSIEECLLYSKPDVLLLSGVIQYLENPFNVIKTLLKYNFKYILIDRTSFIKDTKHRLTIQIVPPEIYQASYPAWFFNEESFMNQFNNYRIIFDFEALDKYNILSAYSKGFLLKNIS